MRALALFVLTAPLLAELSPRQRQIVEEPWAAVEPFLKIPATPPRGSATCSPRTHSAARYTRRCST